MKSRLLILTKRQPKIRMVSLITGAVVIGDQFKINRDVIGLKRPLAVLIQDSPIVNQYQVMFAEWAFGIDVSSIVMLERSKVTSYMIPNPKLVQLYMSRLDPNAFSSNEIDPTALKPAEKQTKSPAGITEEEQIARAMALKTFLNPTLH